MGVFVNNGALNVLNIIKTSNTWQAYLYTAPSSANAITDTFATYTVATFTGSSAITSLGWGTPSTVSSKGTNVTGALTWTLTGGSGQTILGWLLTDLSNNLIYASKFTSSVTLTNVGDQCQVTFTMQDYDQSV